jgi:hypothetical protein
MHAEAVDGLAAAAPKRVVHVRQDETGGRCGGRTDACKRKH